MALPAGDPRINLVAVAQAQEASVWCIEANTDPADLVITVFTIVAAYCLLTTSKYGTVLNMLLILCHLILKIVL